MFVFPANQPSQSECIISSMAFILWPFILPLNQSYVWTITIIIPTVSIDLPIHHVDGMIRFIVYSSMKCIRSEHMTYILWYGKWCAIQIWNAQRRLLLQYCVRGIGVASASIPSCSDAASVEDIKDEFSRDSQLPFSHSVNRRSVQIIQRYFVDYPNIDHFVF